MAPLMKQEELSLYNDVKARVDAIDLELAELVNVPHNMLQRKELESEREEMTAMIEEMESPELLHTLSSNEASYSTPITITTDSGDERKPIAVDDETGKGRRAKVNLMLTLHKNEIVAPKLKSNERL